MTLVLAIKMTVREGEEEGMRDGLVRLAAASRTESGCILFDVHRDPVDPRVFFIYERWVDADALAAHRETDHFRDIAQVDVLPRVEAAERLELELL